MTTIAVARIKKFEDECAHICEESAKFWEELMGEPINAGRIGQNTSSAREGK
jgi:hypothetical protein